MAGPGAKTIPCDASRGVVGPDPYALDLNVHLHMFFVDGVCTFDDERFRLPRGCGPAQTALHHHPRRLLRCPCETILARIKTRRAVRSNPREFRLRVRLRQLRSSDSRHAQIRCPDRRRIPEEKAGFTRTSTHRRVCRGLRPGTRRPSGAPEISSFTVSTSTTRRRSVQPSASRLPAGGSRSATHRSLGTINACMTNCGACLSLPCEWVISGFEAGP